MGNLPANGSRAILVGLIPFAALLVLAALIFTLTSWLEGAAGAWTAGPHAWLRSLDSDSALDTLSNAAEVVAAVLAIAITVVAIVVELAANRYTHRITHLFVREPINIAVMSFFVLTTIQCVWFSATVRPASAETAVLPYAGVAISMAMVTLSLLILLPYFAFVFAFLSPLNVVSRIRGQTLAAVRRATRRGLDANRRQAIDGIEEIEDVALNALEHKDRSIAMASVDALAQLIEDYRPLRGQLPDAWFRLDGPLAHDPDFVSASEVALDDILERRIWFELKVLRNYAALFADSLNRLRDVSNLIAVKTQHLARRALQLHPDLHELAIRFFNSYLRAAINVKDLRTAYYVLHQYRVLAESALESEHSESAVRIARNFRFYGLLAYASDQPFLLEVVAYDLAQITEKALELDSPSADALLAVFLQVDKEGESPEQETSLRGVRRAQVQLAAYLLLRGDERRARAIYQDMEHEGAERLASIRDELLSEEEARYWEITDRDVNFAYLPPERRKKVADFFAWFGDCLPPVTPPVS